MPTTDLTGAPQSAADAEPAAGVFLPDAGRSSGWPTRFSKRHGRRADGRPDGPHLAASAVVGANAAFSARLCERASASAAVRRPRIPTNGVPSSVPLGPSAALRRGRPRRSPSSSRARSLRPRPRLRSPRRASTRRGLRQGHCLFRIGRRPPPRASTACSSPRPSPRRSISARRSARSISSPGQIRPRPPRSAMRRRPHRQQ